MKHKKTMMSVAFLLLGLGGLLAQESLITAGGEATGSGGTTSYTVGQVFYATNSGTNESIAQGVQQPYEIYTLSTDTDETELNVAHLVYPNPTTDILNLNVKNITEALSYRLYNLQGKTVKSNAITSTTTTIYTSNLPSATYIMEIFAGDRQVKKFKVIKN